MNSDRLKQLKAQSKTMKPTGHVAGECCRILPEQLDELEQMAQKEFAPRLEAIFQAALDEEGTIHIKRGEPPDFAGSVLVDLVFGRKEGSRGSWTACLVRMELAPRRNEICLQAGLKLHMNRTIAYGSQDWETRLIEGFEWLLSDSMRPKLRIRN